MQKILKYSISVAITIAFFGVLTAQAQFAGPTDTPQNMNAPLPINVSANKQMKHNSIGVSDNTSASNTNISNILSDLTVPSGSLINQGWSWAFNDIIGWKRILSGVNAFLQPNPDALGNGNTGGVVADRFCLTGGPSPHCLSAWPTATGGGGMPPGTTNQTLRQTGLDNLYGGWVATSTFTVKDPPGWQGAVVDGKLGINNFLPTNALDVVGNTKIVGSATVSGGNIYAQGASNQGVIAGQRLVSQGSYGGPQAVFDTGPNMGPAVAGDLSGRRVCIGDASNGSTYDCTPPGYTFQNGSLPAGLNNQTLRFDGPTGAWVPSWNIQNYGEDDAVTISFPSPGNPVSFTTDARLGVNGGEYIFGPSYNILEGGVAGQPSGRNVLYLYGKSGGDDYVSVLANKSALQFWHDNTGDRLDIMTRDVLSNRDAIIDHNVIVDGNGTGGGRLGIGTNSPQYTIDEVGDIRLISPQNGNSSVIFGTGVSDSATSFGTTWYLDTDFFPLSPTVPSFYQGTINGYPQGSPPPDTTPGGNDNDEYQCNATDIGTFTDVVHTMVPQLSLTSTGNPDYNSTNAHWWKQRTVTCVDDQPVYSITNEDDNTTSALKFKNGVGETNLNIDQAGAVTIRSLEGPNTDYAHVCVNINGTLSRCIVPGSITYDSTSQSPNPFTVVTGMSSVRVRVWGGGGGGGGSGGTTCCSNNTARGGGGGGGGGYSDVLLSVGPNPGQIPVGTQFTVVSIGAGGNGTGPDTGAIAGAGGQSKVTYGSNNIISNGGGGGKGGTHYIAGFAGGGGSGSTSFGYGGGTGGDPAGGSGGGSPSSGSGGSGGNDPGCSNMGRGGNNGSVAGGGGGGASGARTCGLFGDSHSGNWGGRGEHGRAIISWQ